MIKELKPGLLMMIVMTIVTGLVYPAVVTGIAQVLFRDQANGSLVVVNGEVVGSRLIGQNFARPEYFHPRPSAAGAAGYDATASGGTNLGPTSAKLMNGVKDRIVHYCLDNDIPYESSAPLARFKDAEGQLDDVRLIQAFGDTRTPLVFTPKVPIPADAITTSASGLDPHISPRNAELQAVRVARARGVTADEVRALVSRHVESRTLGLLGEPRVNVLELNLALDQQLPRK
ncbi:MAG TPA: potassium-transporting ATPase subunit C [Vicinamibacterales bacterium]|jgi:K+-transporting ATPase ATPase C chain